MIIIFLQLSKKSRRILLSVARPIKSRAKFRLEEGVLEALINMLERCGAILCPVWDTKNMWPS